jgi:hypothetical protein
VGSSDKTTILDRLLEMLKGRGSVSNSRPEAGSRKAERDESKTARKKEKKQERAASGA